MRRIRHGVRVALVLFTVFTLTVSPATARELARRAYFGCGGWRPSVVWHACPPVSCGEYVVVSCETISTSSGCCGEIIDESGCCGEVVEHEHQSVVSEGTPTPADMRPSIEAPVLGDDGAEIVVESPVDETPQDLISDDPPIAGDDTNHAEIDDIFGGPVEAEAGVPSMAGSDEGLGAADIVSEPEEVTPASGDDDVFVQPGAGEDAAIADDIFADPTDEGPAQEAPAAGGDNDIFAEPAAGDDGADDDDIFGEPADDAPAVEAPAAAGDDDIFGEPAGEAAAPQAPAAGGDDDIFGEPAAGDDDIFGEPADDAPAQGSACRRWRRRHLWRARSR